MYPSFFRPASSTTSWDFHFNWCPSHTILVSLLQMAILTQSRFLNLFGHFSCLYRFSYVFISYSIPSCYSRQPSQYFSFCHVQFLFSVFFIGAVSHLYIRVGLTAALYVFLLRTLSEKKVLSWTLQGSSAQRSVGTLKDSRWNLLEMVLGGTLPEKP